MLACAGRTTRVPPVLAPEPLLPPTCTRTRAAARSSFATLPLNPAAAADAARLAHDQRAMFVGKQGSGEQSAAAMPLLCRCYVAMPRPWQMQEDRRDVDTSLSRDAEVQHCWVVLQCTNKGTDKGRSDVTHLRAARNCDGVIRGPAGEHHTIACPPAVSRLQQAVACHKYGMQNTQWDDTRGSCQAPVHGQQEAVATPNW